MKKDEIRKNIVKSLAEKKNIKKVPATAEVEAEVRDMVRSVITEIRPYVDAARIKQMFFDQMPNIMNGSRMQ